MAAKMVTCCLADLLFGAEDSGKDLAPSQIIQLKFSQHPAIKPRVKPYC